MLMQNWANSYDEQFIKQIWKYLYDRELIHVEEQLEFLTWCPDGLGDVSSVRKISKILEQHFNEWIMQQTIYSLEELDECS